MTRAAATEQSFGDKALMMLSTSHTSARRHNSISAIALAGAFLGWHLWFVAGGWHRQQHWVEGTLWGVCGVVGLWSAIDAVRLDRGASWVTLGAVALSVLHVLSLLLFWLFLNLLAAGGPRP